MEPGVRAGAPLPVPQTAGEGRLSLRNGAHEGGEGGEGVAPGRRPPMPAPWEGPGATLSPRFLHEAQRPTPGRPGSVPQGPLGPCEGGLG